MSDSTQKEYTTPEPPHRFRFTLRTMFIVMAMAVVSLWLFIGYRGMLGLFFAVTVLCAGWCVLRGNKHGTAGWLAVFAVAWLVLQFFGPYTSLRNRVVWVVGTKRLQQWAVEVLDNPPPANEYGVILVDLDSLPEDIRSVAGDHNFVFETDDGKGHYISLAHGHRPYQWSIAIGRPGFIPPNPGLYKRLADGVWGYRD